MRRPTKRLIQESGVFLEKQFGIFLPASTTFLSDKKTLDSIKQNKERTFKDGCDDETKALVELFLYSPDDDMVIPNNGTHWFIAGDMENLAVRTNTAGKWNWYHLVIVHRQNDFLFSASWILVNPTDRPNILGYAQIAKSWTKWENNLYYSMSYTDGERYLEKEPQGYIKDLQFNEFDVQEALTR